MAIFHASHKTVGRSTHAAGTAGAHADYIEREEACRIAFGEHMPTKRGETRRWLDEQEQADRKNARVIDKLTLALPLELDATQRIELIHIFIAELTGGKPVPWLAAIHDKGKDEANPHCHLILRDRHIETGKRAIGMSEKGSTERARETWERCVNHTLQEVGSDARVDRRSLKAQRDEYLQWAHTCRSQPEYANEYAEKAKRLDREPTKHIGPTPLAIAQDNRYSTKLDWFNIPQNTPKPANSSTRPLKPRKVTPTARAAPAGEEPPVWPSLAACVADIVSPKGWKTAFWDLLEFFKLLAKDIQHKDLEDSMLADTYCDSVLMRFSVRSRPERLDILKALELPESYDTGDMVFRSVTISETTSPTEEQKTAPPPEQIFELEDETVEQKEPGFSNPNRKPSGPSFSS